VPSHFSPLTRIENNQPGRMLSLLKKTELSSEITFTEYLAPDLRFGNCRGVNWRASRPHPVLQITGNTFRFVMVR
jgi:hypothetical protein